MLGSLLICVVIIALKFLCVTSVALGGTPTISSGGYTWYSIVLQKGDTRSVSISTDGNPVDVMVMDSENFSDYKVAAECDCIKNREWTVLQSGDRITQWADTFKAPKHDRYYFVIDNTNVPTGGANAKKPVKVNVNIVKPQNID